MIHQIRPSRPGSAVDWASAEHQNHKDLPIKSRAAVHILWRAAAALNARFLLRSDDDSDISIVEELFILQQQDVPQVKVAQLADGGPTSSDTQRASSVPLGTASIAQMLIAAREAVGFFGKGSAATHSSPGDAVSPRLRVGAAGAPQFANEVRSELVPKTVRPEENPTPLTAASGGAGPALAATLFAAIAICCMLGFVLRYIDEPAPPINTNAVSYEGSDHTTQWSHAPSTGNASKSTRDRHR